MKHVISLKIASFVLVSALSLIIFPNSAQARVKTNRQGESAGFSGRVLQAVSGASGSIDSQKAQPLAYATVALLRQDSTVVAGTMTAEDGSFKFEDLQEGTYVLSVSYIGYKEQRSALKAEKGSTLNLGDIVLQPEQEALAAAGITERIPLMEVKADKLVMNVSQLPSAQGADALEMLKKAPGIYVDKDGNITLNGQSVAIWIDGRPSNMNGSSLATLLKSTDATTIDKFEIIEHPSAKYDASGSGGIINIKTKKNFMKGLNGTIGGNVGSGIFQKKPYPSVDGTLALSYRTDRNSASVTYSPSYKTNLMTIKNKSLFGEGNKSSMDNNSVLKMKEGSQLVKVGDDYKLTKKDVVGVNFSGVFTDGYNGCSPDENVSVTNIDGVPVMKTFTKIDATEKTSFLTSNANYTHTFNEALGKSLALNFDYSYYGAGNDYHTYYYPAPAGATTAPSVDPTVKYTVNDQYINILSGKADYSTVLFKRIQFETGAKWAKTQTDNRSDDTGVRNDFIYSEQIAAGYVSASAALSQKWMVQAGLRYEHTFADGNWLTSGTKTSKNYGDFFPNALISFNPGKWRFALVYSRRIDRPSFGQLNPSSILTDSHTAISGNPDLDPQISSTYALSIGYSQYLSMSLAYVSQNNYIMQVLKINDTTGFQNFTWDNYGKFQIGAASVSLTQLPLTKWMNFTLSVSALDMKSTASGTGAVNGTVNKRLAVQCYGSLDFTLPKDISASLDVNYMSKMAVAQYIIDPMWVASFSMRKMVFNGRGWVTLKFNDIFRTTSSSLSYFSPDNKTTPVMRFEQHYPVQQKIVLGFTWRFGSSTSGARREHQATDEEKRIHNDAGGMTVGN